ncbi:MAG: caspase family protein [Candidatus Thermoplasmatota archaeon]|nr:caspase family protein [Candidatus Thermoplasmatota archaeon]
MGEVSPCVMGSFVTDVISLNPISEANDVEYWAVIVGIADYDGRENDLPVSRSHLLCFPNALLMGSNWHADHMQVLLNHDATYLGILETLDWLAVQTDENDIVVFSFQGHGSVVEDVDGDEADGFDEGIVAWDGKSGIIIDDILDEKFDAIPCAGMFLVFHSCFSGGLLYQHISDISHFRACYSKETIADIDDDNRVILMSSMDQGLALAFPSVTRQMGWGLQAASKSYTKDVSFENIVTAEQLAKFAQHRINRFFLGLFLIFPPIIVSLALSELIAKVLHGFLILPFPQVYDSFPGELPLFILDTV